MPEFNDQNFYYHDLRGRLLGNKAREALVLHEIAGLGSSDFFLEVGCAQGHFEGKALEHCANVFGGEYAFGKMAAAKRAFPKAEFLGLDAEVLPFRNRAFDFVLCTEVLEHVPDWRKAFAELQRVSRRTVLVTVPLEKGYFWRALSKVKGMGTRGHLHRIGTRELRNALGEGWRVVKQEFVATPSRRLNRVIGKRAKEKIGMYAVMLFERGKGKRPEPKEGNAGLKLDCGKGRKAEVKAWG